MFYLLRSSNQTNKTCPISATKLFYFSVIHVFSGKLYFYFQEFSFAFTTWLFGEWPHFRLSSSFSTSLKDKTCVCTCMCAHVCSWIFLLCGFWSSNSSRLSVSAGSTFTHGAVSLALAQFF